MIHSIDYIDLGKIDNVDILSVFSYHVTDAFQSESTLYICLNIKELLA